MEGAVHYLFWATGVEFAPCPKDLPAAAQQDRKQICGTAPDSFDEFQILLDAAIIKMRREDGPSVTALAEWAGAEGLGTRSFGCCQGIFEMQFHERRALVVVSLPLPESGVIAIKPAAAVEPTMRPPLTGEVILQPGDLLLGPADAGNGPGRYKISIVGPGTRSVPMRMTWEQSKAMDKAYRAGIACNVSLQVLLDVDGKVESAAVTSSTAPDMGFEAAALLALGQWSIHPAHLGNPDGPTPVTLQVVFRAPGASP